MTYSEADPVIRKEAGIAGGQARLLVGTENADDIIADLENVLNLIKFIKTSVYKSEKAEI